MKRSVYASKISTMGTLPKFESSSTDKAQQPERRMTFLTDLLIRAQWSNALGEHTKILHSKGQQKHTREQKDHPPGPSNYRIQCTYPVAFTSQLSTVNSAADNCVDHKQQKELAVVLTLAPDLIDAIINDLSEIKDDPVNLALRRVSVLVFCTTQQWASPLSVATILRSPLGYTKHLKLISWSGRLHESSAGTFEQGRALKRPSPPDTQSALEYRIVVYIGQPQ